MAEKLNSSQKVHKMKKLLLLVSTVFLFAACVAHQEFRPNFNKYVDNVVVVETSPSHVVYEYKNIRVDELAMLAALYCQEQNDKKATLSDVVLYKNNARRATFICDYQQRP